MDPNMLSVPTLHWDSGRVVERETAGTFHRGKLSPS